MYKLIILVVSIVISLCESARILCVFPLPLINHQVVFRALTNELLQRGHELVVVTTDPGYPTNQTPANLKEINIHDLAYALWNAELEEFNKDVINNPHDANHIQIVEATHNLFMKILQADSVLQVINDKFDILLLDANAQSSLILSHIMKAPIILVSSFGSVFNYNIMGAPTEEFVYPSTLRRRFFDAPIWEQIFDIFECNSIQNHLVDFETVQNKAFAEILTHGTPTMNDLYNNVDMLLVNHFPMWEGNHPVSKNVLHLGGLHTKPAEELPQDLQEILNSSTNGVIYVSFGEMDLSLMPSERLQVLVNALSQTPYDVLWKFDKELPEKGPKIKTFKSLPQADLLKNPKVQLFITHGDLQSTDEAIAGGVPIIGFPFMGDQFFNCENYVRHNIGLKLDITTVTEDGLKAAISSVVTDKGFRDNVVTLRTLMYDQPQNSLTRAASWIEHILKHGGQHLRSPASSMPWYQYLELELVFTAVFLYVFIVVTSIVLCYCVIRGVYKCYRKYKHRKMLNNFPR